jgi:hypothetical protein
MAEGAVETETGRRTLLISRPVVGDFHSGMSKMASQNKPSKPGGSKKETQQQGGGGGKQAPGQNKK